MSFAGGQGADLTQSGHDGSYSYYLDIENGLCEPASGSINIPYLAGICTSMGNALTSAIAMNAIVFCDPEWGLESTGAGSAPGGVYGGGGSGGGLIVSW